MLVNCVREFATVHRVSWVMWSVAGYFRIRQGVQGFVDPKGLLNASFEGWQDEVVVEDWWKPWVSSMGGGRGEGA